MKMDHSGRIKELIGISSIPEVLSYEVVDSVDFETHRMQRIRYAVCEREIPAFLLLPNIPPPYPALVVHHQHNGERHLGKSEVCGLVGDPLQAFGISLVQKGFAVLAPDSYCFEDRRFGKQGTQADPEGDEWQHFLALSHGILTGETLAKVVLEDAIGAIGVLQGMKEVNPLNIGCLGHSYGGNTTCFVAALDKRVRYALASGSVASYQSRMERRIGIELASLIPGFLGEFEIVDVIKAISPRKFMIVCATEDKWSLDAPAIYQGAQQAFMADEATENLEIRQFKGGHAITPERHAFIVNWLVRAAGLAE